MFLSLEIRLARRAFCFVAPLLFLASAALAQDKATTTIDVAFQAESTGDNETRSKLLKQALLEDGANAQAHWHAGELKIDGQWLTVPQAIDRTLSSETYADYLLQRQRSSAATIGQAALARWCDRNDLSGPARAHWIAVLRADSTHRAALRALGLTNLNGQIVSAEEAKEIEAKSKQREKQYEQLVNRFEKLRREYLGESASVSRRATDEIAVVTDPEGVWALLDVFANPADDEEVDEAQTKEIHGLLTNALMLVGQPWAMNLLVEQAIASPDESVRRHVREWLKTQPLVEVVPLLLAKLRMPMELGVSVATVNGKVVSSYDEYREGPAGNDYERSYDQYRRIPARKYPLIPLVTNTRVTKAYTTPGYDVPEKRLYSPCGGYLIGKIPAHRVPERHYPSRYSFDYAGHVYSPDESPAYRYREQYAIYEAKQKANYAYASMSMSNEKNNEANEQVVDVLKEVTGEDLPALPRGWWSWWQENYDRHPERREADTLSVSLGLVRQAPPGVAGGTRVWTRTGLRPVEQLKVGDELLSQDPESGELAFKPLLSIDRASGQKMHEVRHASDAIGVTPGQWLWSTGHGWRLAQDLETKGFETGDAETGNSARRSLLHGHQGSHPVTRQAESFSMDVYAVEVDGFATFFAGEPSILLHDATQPAATDAAIPGWRPERSGRE